MKTSLFIIIATLFITPRSWAKNHFVLIGGGGEKGDNTLYDVPIANLNIQQMKDWTYQATYNGGHKNLDNTLKNNFTSPTEPTKNISVENWQATLLSLKKRIESGDIKSGESLVINIFNHGVPTKPNEIGHKLAFGNKQYVHTSDLKEIIKIANEKGINLGILDVSCFSGGTQRIKEANDNVCIITSSEAQEATWAQDNAFPNAFMKILGRPGQTLEDAFLEARSSMRMPNDPTISTKNFELAREKFKKDGAWTSDMQGAYMLSKEYAWMLGDMKYALMTARAGEGEPDQEYGEDNCRLKQEIETTIVGIEKIHQHLNNTNLNKERDEYIKSLRDYASTYAEVIKDIQKTTHFHNNHKFTSDIVDPKTGKPLMEIKITYKNIGNTIAKYRTPYPELIDSLKKEHGDKADLYLKAMKEISQKMSVLLKEAGDKDMTQEGYDHSIKSFEDKYGKKINAAVEKVQQKNKEYFNAIYNSYPKDANDPCRKIRF